MNNQAMTKLAAEFYERGRQAALIDAGLIKVANKGFNRGFYGSLLGLSAAQLALAAGLREALKGAPKVRVPLLKDRSSEVVKAVTDKAAPTTQKLIDRVEEGLKATARKVEPLGEKLDPAVGEAVQQAKETGTRMLDSILSNVP